MFFQTLLSCLEDGLHCQQNVPPKIKADLPGHRGVLWATAVPLMGLPFGVTHQQYPV